MNYGKKKAAKRQKQITSKSAMQAKRVGVRLFKALLLLASSWLQSPVLPVADYL